MTMSGGGCRGFMKNHLSQTALWSSLLTGPLCTTKGLLSRDPGLSPQLAAWLLVGSFPGSGGRG